MRPLPLLLALLACVPLLLLSCARDRTTPSPSPSPSPPVLPSPGAVNDLLQARVLRVIDGATIEVESAGQRYRIRYLGIQIPEGGGAEDEGRTLSKGAEEFNRFLVEGKTVELAKDAVDADLMGNLLRYVFVGGEMVNKTLLENGYASVADFPPTFRYKAEFAAAEENARADRRGIWTHSQPDAQQHATPQPTPSMRPGFRGGTLPSMELIRRAEKCDYSGTREPLIKGNIDSRTGERIYHVPGGLFYSTTVVDEARGDRWFCTEEEAIAAGWKKSKR